MEAIATQIRELVENNDDAYRKRVVTELRNLSIDLEDNDDTLHRLSHTPLQLCGAWIGSSLRIFELVSNKYGPMSLKELAHDTQADSILLGRLLRYMASIKLIDEFGQDLYSSNNVTKTLATPKGQNFLALYYNIVSPTYYELPRFFQKSSYQNPCDGNKTPFQDAHNFKGPIFAWWATNPDKAAIFNKHMEFMRDDGANWLDVFPIEEHAALLDSSDVLFVDVGGNVGHQCARLKATYPHLTGRVILQDLPYAIENALSISGVESMVHDSFDPQPIKGARIYYMRGVLHCFPDNKCIQILQSTARAMSAASIVLVDEASLPSVNVSWQAAQMDIQMMSSLASMYRTHSQWEEVFSAAGLKIKSVYVYNFQTYESVIMAIRA